MCSNSYDAFSEGRLVISQDLGHEDTTCEGALTAATVPPTVIDNLGGGKGGKRVDIHRRSVSLSFARYSRPGSARMHAADLGFPSR